MSGEDINFQLRLEAAKQSFRRFYPFSTVQNEKGLIFAEPWSHFFDPQYSPQNISLVDALLQGKSGTMLKARQLGASWLFTAFNVWDAQFNTVLPIQNFSQGEEEAKELIRKAEVVYDNLPPGLQVPLKTKPTSKLIEWQDGAGRLMAFPSTKKAGRSYTSRRSFADENAFHEYALENFNAAEPQAEAMWLVSTANGENFFKEQFWSSWRGESDNVSFFYPWWVRPDRQNADGTPSQTWYDAKLAKFKGFEEDFRAEYPATPQEAFLSKGNLVYPMFSQTKHVLPVPPVPFEDTKIRLAGVDWGGNDPTAIVILGVTSSGHVHQYNEWYQDDGEPPILEEMAAYLREWNDYAPLHGIYCDNSEPGMIRNLGMHFGGVQPSKANRSRPEGLGLTAALLKQERLTLSANCVKSIAEFYSYKRRISTDPNTKERYYSSGGPVPNHGDAMDARRYALMALISMQTTPSDSVGTLDGSPIVRKAV